MELTFFRRHLNCVDRPTTPFVVSAMNYRLERERTQEDHQLGSTSCTSREIFTNWYGPDYKKEPEHTSYFYTSTFILLEISDGKKEANLPPPPQSPHPFLI